MEIGIVSKLKVARQYLKFLRTLKRCGVCNTLARTYNNEPQKMPELMRKLCPDCSRALTVAGESILRGFQK